MQVSFNQVKAITDTLPIGLYASRRIDTILKDKEECSYYNPESDNIVISYEQLTSGFKNLKPTDNIETIIRSMFYHEVSHAIITPKTLPNPDYMNIFEDERIETVLNGYYYGTNFDQCKKAVCEYDPNHIPQNSLDAFFYLVRFRQCSEQSYLDRVADIIKKFATLHRGSPLWTERYMNGNKKMGYGDYCNEVARLYQDFTNDCQAQGIPKMLGNMGGQGQPQQAQGKGQMKGDIDPNAQLNDDMMKGKGEHQENATPQPLLSAEQIQELFAESLNQDFNGEFHTALSILFENFRKKNSKGSCLQGYSGVINPRLADRVDYRFFERSTASRGNNQFGTFHLNLFIDVSGSYDGNTKPTNQIIKSLCLLEKKNPNFTFDVITTNTYSQVLPKGKRFIECNGGTYLGTIIEDIYRKQQKPQTYNYNIILFDGDAYWSRATGANNKDYAHKGQGFATFANNNCTIISDYENKVYIDKYAPNTRTIYTNNYPTELFDNILKVMQRALS